jgi:Tfp pilus assembly protein PilV
VLVAVLVCLAIATALVTSTVRSALDGRRAMRTQHQLRQTELLLAAGVQRARRQWQATSADQAADYRGETWTLSPRVIPHVESAQVKIEITPAAEKALREVHVTARLLVAADKVIQRSTSFSIGPK